jgi:hypothetical protein
VATAAHSTEIFRRSRQRGASAEACPVANPGWGWADGPRRGDDAGRLLVAVGWVAAGFLGELGVTRQWPELRLRRRWGGGAARANPPTGTIVLARGRRRLVDLLATEPILADERRRSGPLPPRIAALLAPPADPGVTAGCQQVTVQRLA